MPDLKFWFRSANQEALQRYVISLLSRRRRRRLSSSSTWTQWLHIHAVITEGIQSSHTWRQFVHTDTVTAYVCICTICLQVTTKQHLSLEKLTRRFELRMGFLFLSGGDTVFCSIFINRHVCLCITHFMNACLNSTHLLNLLTTGSKTN